MLGYHERVYTRQGPHVGFANMFNVCKSAVGQGTRYKAVMTSGSLDRGELSRNRLTGDRIRHRRRKESFTCWKVGRTSADGRTNLRKDMSPCVWRPASSGNDKTEFRPTGKAVC